MEDPTDVLHNSEVEKLKMTIEYLKKHIRMLNAFIHFNYEYSTTGLTNTVIDMMLGEIERHGESEDCMDFRNNYETMDADARATRTLGIIKKAIHHALKNIGEL